jgi:hypothetical protein
LATTVPCAAVAARGLETPGTGAAAAIAVPLFVPASPAVPGALPVNGDAAAADPASPAGTPESGEYSGALVPGASEEVASGSGIRLPHPVAISIRPAKAATD